MSTTTSDQEDQVTKELLRTSIGTIMYTRSLLPKSCFVRRSYPMKGYMLVSSVHQGYKEADRMLANLEDIFHNYDWEKVVLVRFIISGTVKEPNSPDKKHVLEIYNIDFNNRLELAMNCEIGGILRKNTIALADVHKQLLATVNKLEEVAKSFGPFATIETYYAITGPWGIQRKSGANESLMYAPYNRWIELPKSGDNDPGSEATGGFAFNQNVGENKNIDIEDIKIGDVIMPSLLHSVFVRRISSSSPLPSEALTEGFPVSYYKCLTPSVGKSKRNRVH